MLYKKEFKEIYYRFCRNHSTVKVNQDQKIIKIKIGNPSFIPKEIENELNVMEGYIQNEWIIFEDRTIFNYGEINQIEEAFLHMVDQILYIELLFEHAEEDKRLKK